MFTSAKSRHALSAVFLAVICLGFSGPVVAAETTLTLAGPATGRLEVQPLERIPQLLTDAVDFEAARYEDGLREEAGLAPRFALTDDVMISPETAGLWEDVPGGYQLWRYRIASPGALSLNLGFTAYRLPKGARLTIAPADVVDKNDERGVYTYDSRDNEAHGELWTPVILADDVIVELLMPELSRSDYRLELTTVNKGYRFFGEDLADKSGYCNIDVICPEGDDWRAEINSVGVISTGGSTYCTGFMINNTDEDATPYFMTAYHCEIDSGNAASLVVYWNFQSPTCGQQGGGSLSQNQTGSYYRAQNSASDFTLVELDSDPNPAYGVTFAGWNRSASAPSSAVAIHHPSTDEKSISFENQATTVTSYFGTSVPGNSTHIRVADWDLGTTEGGSSGSPLFGPDHRVVGQLHGGYAACGNNSSDWYGRFYYSWTRGLSSYLDPSGSGAMTTDTFDPAAVHMKVTPGTGLVSEGPVGGPFTPANILYRVYNQSGSSLSYLVSADVDWVSITNASGTLNNGSSAYITVTLDADANALPGGIYDGTISFTNLTDGEGDTTRPMSLRVGSPEVVYSWNLDTNPGWTVQNQWAWGQPTGGGGQYGNPDPTSGYTGNYVYGYNLNGDYGTNLAEQALTADPFDCSDVSATTLKFWRWLGVEENQYDHASIKVSANGTNWTTIWSNPDSHTEDGAWSQQVYDISDIADGQSTVYVRWIMGTTDDTWQFCGWNIDDVEIWGLVEGGPTAANDLPDYRIGVDNYPNPFNPVTRIDYTIEQSGSVHLSVYDVQGRLIRRLVDESVAAGNHSVVWDGLSDSGQRVGSGVYFARLRSGGQQTHHKMVLLK